MMSYEKEWLEHLKDSVPIEAYGYSVSMYSIALEGWRRGLKLTFINNNRAESVTRYCLSNGVTEHCFIGSMGDKVTSEAKKICKNKHLTKKYLSKFHVPTPKGEKFSEDATNQEVINYANLLGYPVVLKPSDGMGGRGVISNIKNSQELLDALTYVRGELEYKEIMIESFFKGEDYRLYVIDGKVEGAIKRIPANVIGDGKSTVRQLLSLKNKERNLNPALYQRPIKIDLDTRNQLKSYGYSLDSIPKMDERVFLKTKSNISAGGDPIDVTERLTDKMKDIAVKAVESIPGLNQSGVDLMVNLQTNDAIVLELNTIPSIRTHLFPMEGKARDIPKAIIDYYFPNTDTNIHKPLYYFDIKSVFQMFQSGVGKQYTVPDVPKGANDATRFIIEGKVKKVSYERWIQNKARELKLHGHIKSISNEKTSIVISGATNSVNEMRKVINDQSSKKGSIHSIIEKVRTSPVKTGFYIMDDFKKNNSTRNDTLKKKRQQANSKNTLSYSKSFKKSQSLYEERDYYKSKYNEMMNSRSWKITKPIRKMNDLIKKIFKVN